MDDTDRPKQEISIRLPSTGVVGAGEATAAAVRIAQLPLGELRDTLEALAVPLKREHLQTQGHTQQDDERRRRLELAQLHLADARNEVEALLRWDEFNARGRK